MMTPSSPSAVVFCASGSAGIFISSPGRLVEAAGEDLRGLFAEVARVVLVVEADAEYSLRVPVERAVDHFVVGNRLFYGERLGLGFAAGVVPLGERFELLLLYEREYLALGLEARAQAERRQRQQAALRHEPGALHVPFAECR